MGKGLWNDLEERKDWSSDQGTKTYMDSKFDIQLSVLKSKNQITLLIVEL